MWGPSEGCLCVCFSLCVCCLCLCQRGVSASTSTHASTPGSSCPTLPGRRLPYRGLLSSMPVSVMPYRSRSLCPDKSRHCCCSFTGSGADPLTVTRKRCAACWALCWSAGDMVAKCCNMYEYMVGTPMNIVTGSSSLMRDSQTAAGEKRGSISTAAPAECAVSSAATAPWMWCSGSACSSRSHGTMSHASFSAAVWALRLSCVCTAALGAPVVPLVYTNRAARVLT
mmetsp:Transcript_11705/g.35127  ORF Transcript_11705/g.35127 Transcript_11705/m.35127 type:complete len:226 (+) Transcript_11705:836-1513(+)